MSASHKGHPTTEETRHKIRKSNLGKKRSKDTCRKLHETHLGKKHSEETRRKMSLSEIEAVDYVRLVTDRSHGVKFDILVKDSFPPGLAERLGVFFHASGLRARPGEVQINSRPLAEWLMKNHDVLPVRVYDDQHPAPTPSSQDQ